MTTVIDKTNLHSPYGGSSIGRVIACAGSVALNATVPNIESGYASEGTVAHTLAELCLKQSLHPTHFLGEAVDPKYPTILVTQKMCDAVVVYLNAIEQELAQTKSGELYVEKSFEIESDAAPGEVWGKNDAAVYHPETGRLRMFDYKHGVGVSVSADDSAQLKFYAMGAVFSNPDWRITEIICTIIQPRARDADEVGAVKDWKFDVVELLEFQADVEAAIERAKTVAEIFGNPTYDGSGVLDYFATGAHCRWCDAAAVCPAKEAEALAAATLDFASVTEVTAPALPEPKSLDVERLSAIVAGLNIVTAWQAQCQEYLEGLVLSGVEVPGWKAVEKIGRAKWIDDPAEVAAYVDMQFGIETDQIMPRKLTTIGDAEKLLKAAGAPKEKIDDFKLKFTIKESSGLTIAPASDRRPAVNAIAADFGSVKL